MVNKITNNINLRFKILHCTCRDQWAVYRKGDDVHIHGAFLGDEEAGDETAVPIPMDGSKRLKEKKTKASQVRGIHCDIKKHLLTYMDDDNDITPKKMLIKLLRNHKKKRIIFKLSVLPHVKQVKITIHYF